MSWKTASILLGRCMEVCRIKGVEVTVTMRELDTFWKMFFPERYTVYAYDAKDQCRVGDILLIKKLTQPMTRKITHEVVNVIYPIGDVTDPITGKKVVVQEYRDHMIEIDKRYCRNSRGGYTKYLGEKLGNSDVARETKS